MVERQLVEEESEGVRIRGIALWGRDVEAEAEKQAHVSADISNADISRLATPRRSREAPAGVVQQR